MPRRNRQAIFHEGSSIWSGKWKWVLWGASGLMVLFGFYLTALYIIVTDRFEGKRWRLPSNVYSDSFILYPGQNIKGIRLLTRLKRLGYLPVSEQPTRPGEYQIRPEALDIFLHDFSYPDKDFSGFSIHLTIDQGRIKGITRSLSGEKLALFELEPELIAGFFDQDWEERDLVQLEDVPPHLIEAILAVEDNRFYRHAGIDPRSIARAFWVNLKEWAIVQGGSTLTQQLVKNFYLNSDRTFRRKLNEVFMALLLDLRYSKNEILEAYLNEIYLAQSGVMGIYGIGKASRYYFDKKPNNLTLGQSALLAGIIQSPNLHSPFKNQDRAVARKTVVLKQMLKFGKISQTEYHRAINEAIPDTPPMRQERIAPYFVDFVRQQLSEIYAPEVLTSEGLRIFTTLDIQQQMLAEQALRKGLERLESQSPQLRREDPLSKLQGSLIAIQPQTGQIRVMVGGRNYATSQFNRAVQARRQPGSLFKPFVYATALAQEGPSRDKPYTPATLIEDSLVSLVVDDGVWTPQNYDKKYHGTVTLRTALEKSLNVATVRLADELGIHRVIETAQAMGIRSPLKAVPSLALGTSEVSALELATAYATIGNGGLRVEPLAIKEVVSENGHVLERRTFEMTPVLTPQQAFLLTHLLVGVVERGTARGVHRMGFSRPVAGKTGTTNAYKDSWFVGFTPNLLGLVWVGFDNNPADEFEDVSMDQGFQMTGASAALPIWTDFMKQAMIGLPVNPFIAPPGIVFKSIDPKSGLLSNQTCPGGIREAFVQGTEPRQSCENKDRFPSKVLKWIKKIF